MSWIADKLDDLKIFVMCCVTGFLACAGIAFVVFVEVCTAPRKSNPHGPTTPTRPAR